MIVLFYRRMTNARANAVTSELDWILLWSSSCFKSGLVFGSLIITAGARTGILHTAVPWLISLAQIPTRYRLVAALPFWVKFHFLNGFVDRIAVALHAPCAFAGIPALVFVARTSSRDLE
jgi:nitrate reductase gamma subunit